MKGIIVQIVSTLIISQGNYFTGYAIAWSTHALEALESDQAPIGTRISQTESNLISSLPMLGCFMSTFFSGWLADIVGRKRTTILNGLCFVLGWSLLATANSVIVLLASRFIIGLATGIHMVACIPFIGELTQKSIRGTATSILGFTYTFGTLVAYVLGWMCSYDVVTYINLTHSVIYVLLVSCLKETPAHLLVKGRQKEALESLKFYRGVSKSTQDILDELKYMRSQQESNDVNVVVSEKLLSDEKPKLQHEDGNQNSKMSPWKTLCTSKPNQRALITTIVNMILLLFGGTIAVTAYAAQLFAVASPKLSPHVCSVILAVAFFVGSFLATIITDLVGRRVIMITSSFTASICLAVVASLLRWSWAPEWTIPAAVLAYCCCFQVGVVNVPFVQLAEQFPPKLNSLTTMISGSVMNISNFIVLSFFAPTVDSLGLDGTFLLFAVICVLTTVFNYYFMKETKGASLEVIQKMYEEGYLYRKRSK